MHVYVCMDMSSSGTLSFTSYLYVCMDVYVCVYSVIAHSHLQSTDAYVCVCMYVCMQVCMCVYRYTYVWICPVMVYCHLHPIYMYARMCM